jgi:hypothetical protein
MGYEPKSRPYANLQGPTKTKKKLQIWFFFVGSFRLVLYPVRAQNTHTLDE